jgi:hypothetical protein
MRWPRPWASALRRRRRPQLPDAVSPLTARGRCTCRVIAALVALCVVACATTQSKFRWLGSSYPAKPASFAVGVFESALPTRPFEKIARLDAHFEKTGFMPTARQTGLEELKKQARAAGADGIIEIQELHSHVGETLILLLAANGIRYTEAP